MMRDNEQLMSKAQFLAQVIVEHYRIGITFEVGKDLSQVTNNMARLIYDEFQNWKEKE